MQAAGAQCLEALSRALGQGAGDSEGGRGLGEFTEMVLKGVEQRRALLGWLSSLCQIAAGTWRSPS